MQLNSSSTRFVNAADATIIPMPLSSNGHNDKLLSETVLNHQKQEIAQILMRAFVIPKAIYHSQENIQEKDQVFLMTKVMRS